MHVHQLAVIIAFNEDLLNKAISFLENVPILSNKFQEPPKKYLVEERGSSEEERQQMQQVGQNYLDDMDYIDSR